MATTSPRILNSAEVADLRQNTMHQYPTRVRSELWVIERNSGRLPSRLKFTIRKKTPSGVTSVWARTHRDLQREMLEVCVSRRLPNLQFLQLVLNIPSILCPPPRS